MRVVLCVAAALMFCAPANAASVVGTGGGTLTVTSGDEANDVVLNPCCGDRIQVTDDIGGATAGAGCTQIDATKVECAMQPSAVVSLAGGDDSFGYGAGSDCVPQMALDAGSGDDMVIANSFQCRDTIDGGDGSDQLQGNGGDDTIHGGPGSDAVYGGSENDSVYGDEGDDTVRGDGGDDIVDGGAGRDSLSGDAGAADFLAGNDEIRARDGEPDRAACGLGADQAIADSADLVDSDCEQVDRGASGGGGGGGGPSGGGGGTSGVALSGVPRSLKLTKAVHFRVTFGGSGHVTALLFVARKDARRLHLAKRDLVLASQSDAVPAAGSYEATLKVRASLRRKLAAHSRVPAYVGVQFVDDAGQESVDSRKVTIKR